MSPFNKAKSVPARAAISAVVIAGSVVLGGCVAAAVNTDRSAGDADPSSSPQATSGASSAVSTPLSVGDCFTSSGTDAAGKPIAAVVDCATPHDHEVTAVFTSIYAGDPFDATGFATYVDATCASAYESYTGNAADAPSSSYAGDTPTESAWNAGDFTFACYASAPEGATLKASVAEQPSQD